SSRATRPERDLTAESGASATQSHKDHLDHSDTVSNRPMLMLRPSMRSGQEPSAGYAGGRRMPAGCKTLTSAPPATLPGQLVVAMSRHEGTSTQFRYSGAPARGASRGRRDRPARRSAAAMP